MSQDFSYFCQFKELYYFISLEGLYSFLCPLTCHASRLTLPLLYLDTGPFGDHCYEHKTTSTPLIVVLCVYLFLETITTKKKQY